MTLEELLKREKELREKYGDDWFENRYLHEQQAESLKNAQVNKPAQSAAQTQQLTPLFFKTTPLEPTIGNGVTTPKAAQVSQPDALKKPAAAANPLLKKLLTAKTGQNTENSFYTNKTNSGTITNRPVSIADFRKGIDDITKKIEELNKQQYNHMLSGNNSKINALDKVIKDAEKQKETLQTGMAKAMGIGSENENKDKDILRSSNNQAVTGKPEFAVQQNKAINTQFNFPAETSGKQDDGKDNKDNGGTGNPDNTGNSDNVNNKIIDALKSCDERGNGPEPLYVPGTFNDYVDRGGYKNPIEYYKAVEDHAAVYIKNDNGEGLQRFLKENKLDKDPSFKFWLGLNNKDGGDEGEKDTITAAPPDNQDKYNMEKKQRADTLKYIPSDEFNTLVSDGLKTAQENLSTAMNDGDKGQTAKYKVEKDIYSNIKNMSVNPSEDNSTRYSELKNGLSSVQELADMYKDDIKNAASDSDREAAQSKLDIINKEIIAINRGMNVVGEAYLDDIDTAYKNQKMTCSDYITAYKNYYQSVIDRESRVEVKSTTIKEGNLTLANASTGSDMNLLGVLDEFDVPLYSSENDAVLAFKKEAMPLTLKNNNEYSAYLDSADFLDTETGQVKKYYYYVDVKQGNKYDVVLNAIIGAGGGEDRKLLHTHPVEGYWGRTFSGDPDNDGLNKYYVNDSIKTFSGLFRGMGDSSVADWMGYGGIYVIDSGGEAKLYKGHGKANIGSGYNTYANTQGELEYVSTLDLY